MGCTIRVLAGTAKALPIGVVYAIGALPGLVDFRAILVGVASEIWGALSSWAGFEVSGFS
jgi:hypothetical protein